MCGILKQQAVPDVDFVVAKDVLSAKYKVWIFSNLRAQDDQLETPFLKLSKPDIRVQLAESTYILAGVHKMSATGMVIISKLCSKPSIHIIYASCDSHTVSCMCSGPGVLKNQLSLHYGCGDVCWSIGRFRMILLGCLHSLAWEYVLLEYPLVSPEWRLSLILVNAINWAEYCGFLSYFTKLYSTLNKGK